jgi:glucosamine-6-phosphate deaminase
VSISVPDAPELSREPRVEIVRGDLEMSQQALRIVAATLRARPDAVVSLTTGHTTAGLYRLLGTECRMGRLDLSRARIVSSEEYAGVGAADPISLFRWLHDVLLAPCGVPRDHTVRLVGDAVDLDEECRRFDAAIEQLGGLDLVVQSMGTNGHFGFNEPGSTREAPSRAVTLAPSTLAANRRYWSKDAHVPARGLTMGLSTTLRARHVLLLVSGESKAAALARALGGPIDAAAPCSLLRLAARLTVVADARAAAQLDRHSASKSGPDSEERRRA